MARHRRGSIVQNIASKVVSHAPEEWRPQSELSETQHMQNPMLSTPSKDSDVIGLNRKRSNSFPSCRETIILTSNMGTPLYPFSVKENEMLTQNYLQNLNYNTVLDYKHITDINDHNDALILSFQADCNRNINYFQELLNETSQIMNDLGSLTFHYDQVMKDTEEFASQSRDLLQKQDELGKRADEMDHVMNMFEPLESLSKALSTSGTNLIRSGRWKKILAQLQENLQFFETHKAYRDAEVYTMRYRQCITRTLTLVRNYNIDFLKDASADVTDKLQKADIDPLKLDMMMYSELINDLEKQTDNTKFPTLITAIASQCVGHKEYQGLVSDVLQQYFKLRKILIQKYLEKEALFAAETQGEKKIPEKYDIVQHCQKVVSQFKRLLEKEYTIFDKFFPYEAYDNEVGQFVEGELYIYLKQVLEPFYDDMRNKILRETSITELSHLANLLTSYYELDDDTASHGSAVDNKLEYAELLEPVLNDCQSRLIFRIQNYIDNKLLKYKPRPEDLQLGNRRKSTGKDSILEEFEGNLFPELYVPVGKALTILSNLYELVNSVVFDDIAHFIIHSCIFMLKNGAMGLANTHLGTADAKLFYLKNLTMLKNHLNTFDIQFVRTETSLDLTGGIQELIRIFRSGSFSVNLNSQGGFLELVKKSVPKVINDMIDAKQEIELELSNAFNDFITDCTNSICEPILNESGTSLKDKTTKLSDNILMEIPQIHKQISTYLEEDEFVAYLLNVLSRLILSTYETFHRTTEGKLASSAHADELNEIMEPDTFFNFLAETINGLQDSVELKQGTFEFNEDILNGPDTFEPNDLVVTEKDDEVSPGALE